ncbi:MAG: bifunctional DNA primase/polymerase [Cognatishimia sp.]
MTNPKLNFEQVRFLDEAGYQLLQLHRWDQKRADPKTQKVRLLGKAPIEKRWTTSTESNQDVIAKAKAAKSNIGVKLNSEQLVVDIDPRSIEGGVKAALKKLKELGVFVQEYPVVRTGSRGLHIYMSKPSDLVLRDSLSKHWRGIEFKSKGRQVVAPGSIHPNGKPYKWEETQFLPGELWLGAPMAPEALLTDAMRPTRSATYEQARAGAGEHPPGEIAIILKRMNVEDFRDYDDWLKLMMSIHHASSGAALPEFLAWSLSDPLYSSDEQEITNKWHGLQRHGIGLGTLYMYMKQQNCQHLIDRRPRIVSPTEFEGEI